MVTSPFRTTGQLGPDLHQQVTPGEVWYDNPDLVSPVVGTRETGDDGFDYVWVRASANVAAASAPGTQVSITVPAYTAAAGAGGFYAPIAGVTSGDYFWAKKGSTL